MQYAVKSFATRALDEWILDYPQQIIMTTLNLVLTIEINDYFEKKMSDREAEEASDNDDKKDEEDGSNEEEANTEANKTQDDK